MAKSDESDDPLVRIEALCRRIAENQADPTEVLQALSDITAVYRLVNSIVEGTEDQGFYAKQLVGLWRGYRDDQVQMRTELRDLRIAVEALGAALELMLIDLPPSRRRHKRVVPELVNPIEAEK